MNTSSVHLHVKPDFSRKHDSGNKICFQNENRKQTRNQNTGLGFATNHRNSMTTFYISSTLNRLKGNELEVTQ